MGLFSHVMVSYPVIEFEREWGKNFEEGKLSNKLWAMGKETSVRYKHKN